MSELSESVDQIVRILHLLPKVADLEAAVDALLVEEMTPQQIIEAVQERLDRVMQLRRIVADEVNQ